MKNENELHQLDDIRKMMIRSSRFISLSGLSGIFAGIFALAGAVAAHYYLRLGDEPMYENLRQDIEIRPRSVLWNTKAMWFMIIDALVVLLLSIGFGILFTTRKAKKDGLKIWDLSARRLISSLAIPLLTGGVLCLLLLIYGPIRLIAPSMLIFYGLALVNASNYSLRDIKFLGIFEIVLGLIAVAFPGKGLFFWAFGFGILHILYGIIMYVRYER